jgi:triosephosphate isomerase
MDVSHKMAHMYPTVGDKADSHKFIAQAMKHIKKGALTATAKHADMKPLQFAKEVVEHPEHHTDLTRKRAQFALNIQRK